MKYLLIKDNTVQGFLDTTPANAEALKAEWQYVVPDPGNIPFKYGYANGAFFPRVEEAAPVDHGTKISVLSFLKRFTDPEAIAIDLGSIGATVQAASLRRYVAMVNAAKFIDLTCPDTRAGVLALETAGILAPGRALQILDTPITLEEKA